MLGQCSALMVSLLAYFDYHHVTNGVIPNILFLSFGCVYHLF